MKNSIVKAADIIKSVGGAIAVAVSLLGGGIGLVVWVYSLRAEVTQNKDDIEALQLQHDDRDSLGQKVDQLTRAINEQNRGGESK